MVSWCRREMLGYWQRKWIASYVTNNCAKGWDAQPKRLLIDMMHKW